MDDIEAIKQLKARYFRTLDTKDWVAWRQVFTADVVVDTTESGGSVVTGADEFVAFVREQLGDRPTAHHGHTAEIELTGPTSATAIWAMSDRVELAGGLMMRGAGHYHDTYAKTDGEWLIARSRLTRLRVDVTLPGVPLRIPDAVLARLAALAARRSKR